MDTFKLRLKVGPHEFEAEGLREDVQAQFDAWKTLIAAAPAQPQKETPQRQQTFADSFVAEGVDTKPVVTDPALGLFETDGNSITLRAYPSGEQADDAVLLVAYAFKRIHNQDILSSVLLGKSLRISGGTIDRVDRVVAQHISKGFMMKAGGVGRGTKYRLTNTGSARAEALMKELVGKLN